MFRLGKGTDAVSRFLLDNSSPKGIRKAKLYSVDNKNLLDISSKCHFLDYFDMSPGYMLKVERNLGDRNSLVGRGAL